MFEYAETVATYMNIIFAKSNSNQIKVRALEIAIKKSISANRFAARDTCMQQNDL